MVDELTGLGRRGQLDVDLNLALERGSAPSLLVVYDLDGTGLEKPMSRVRGEALLRELATTLKDTLGADAACYRSREVELSALIYAPLQPAMTLAKTAAAALGANPASSVPVVHFGAAVLPEEASTPLDAIKLADRRRKYPTLPPPGSGGNIAPPA
jgi:GGDEF domain-containing protein